MVRPLLPLVVLTLPLLGMDDREGLHAGRTAQARSRQQACQPRRPRTPRLVVSTDAGRHLPQEPLEPAPAGELPGGGVGWADANPEGWNAREALVGTIRRIPLDGLRTTNDDPALSARHPLLERADRRAVVLVPVGLDVERPVDVLVHLHGFDTGYRQERHMTRRDPVRDVDIDRIEEQLAGRQLLVLLPQGGLHAEFAPRSRRGAGKAFDLHAFVDEVLERLDATRLLSPRPPLGRLLLSAHSGGGEALGVMVPGIERLGLVALFDAINGPREELPRLQRWLAARLEQDLAALRGKDAAEQQKYLASSLRFRAYFTRTRRYAPLHDDPDLQFAEGIRPLRQFLDDWFAAHAEELGGPSGAAWLGLRANYQVLGVAGVSHDRLVGAGTLRDALGALPSQEDTAGELASVPSS
ncbi:MAG: hypothetical protein RMK29_03790 [Myxococcales bacterium]|nr:hypothetical protein [Myxococcota bacterium]MDW8280809.1 hypothetical protein [Myxococcales bacterium]